MQDHVTSLGYLEQLATVLADVDELTAELNAGQSRPHLLVANAATPTMQERIYATEAGDGSWSYCWQWNTEIGGVGELAAVVAKIVDVLRSVTEVS